MLLYNRRRDAGIATDNHLLPTVHLASAEGAALLTFLGAHTGVTATFTAGIATRARATSWRRSARAAARPRRSASASPTSPPPACRSSLATRRARRRSPAARRRAVPGDPGHVDVEPARRRRGGAAQGPASRLDAGPDQVRADDDRHAGRRQGGRRHARRLRRRLGPRSTSPRRAIPASPSTRPRADYLALDNQLWNANYPSVYVPSMPGIITVQRTAHSELGHRRNGTSVQRRPTSRSPRPEAIALPGGAHTFDITVDARPCRSARALHAQLVLTHGPGGPHPDHDRAPQASVTLSKTCAPDRSRAAADHLHHHGHQHDLRDARSAITDPLPEPARSRQASRRGDASGN